MHNIFPSISFSDKDIISIYEYIWTLVKENWQQSSQNNGQTIRYYNSWNTEAIDQFDAMLSTFFLTYGNNAMTVFQQLDNFYSKQEDNGAIRCSYSNKDGQAILSPHNSEGIGPPLFSWAEFNLYHKAGNKKRVREKFAILERYWDWIEDQFCVDNGLYSVPWQYSCIDNANNADREGAAYPVDFNIQQAINAKYMSHLAEAINDKESNFRYKKRFFALKSRINDMMWNDETAYYYDLDDNCEQLSAYTSAALWALLGTVVNGSRYQRFLKHIYVFPASITSESATDSEQPLPFSSPLEFIIVKGLEQYQEHELARDYALNRLLLLRDSIKIEEFEEQEHAHYGASDNSDNDEPAQWLQVLKNSHVTYSALGAITLVIENIIGIDINIPRKTVDWAMPSMETMGIANLALRHNKIAISTRKVARGWELLLESEKLYYFTIHLPGGKQKTLPISSGRCFLMVGKI